MEPSRWVPHVEEEEEEKEKKNRKKEKKKRKKKPPVHQTHKIHVHTVSTYNNNSTLSHHNTVALIICPNLGEGAFRKEIKTHTHTHSIHDVRKILGEQIFECQPSLFIRYFSTDDILFSIMSIYIPSLQQQNAIPESAKEGPSRSPCQVWKSRTGYQNSCSS